MGKEDLELIRPSNTPLPELVSSLREAGKNSASSRIRRLLELETFRSATYLTLALSGRP
jgi:hypothetical protein